MKARCLLPVLALALAAIPGPATANGEEGTDWEPVATYTPDFADTREEVETSDGALPDSTGSGDADASGSGMMQLAASTTGWSGLGHPGASARSEAAILGTPFTWAGNQLRLKATISWRLKVTRETAARAQLAENNEDWLRVSVSGRFEGETRNQIQYEGWSEGDRSAQGVALNADDERAGWGKSTVTTYSRVPCEGATITPFVQAAVSIAPDESSLLADETRSAVLEVYVSKIEVHQTPSMPCHRIADIAVFDNGFTPAAVTIERYNYVRFDFSQAQTYHNVVIPWWGSPYPGDAIPVYQTGTTIYYCSIHGTPEGAGMAGTITVT